MKPKPLQSVLLLASLLVVSSLSAAEPMATDPARESRMAWWRDARFGMFVHWGLYSGLAGTWNDKMVSKTGGLEWIQQRVGADTYSYAAQALPKFQPKPDFAQAWARLAKEAGCQYVVFTTKHHEGFALHDSKLTQYDAGDLLNIGPKGDGSIPPESVTCMTEVGVWMKTNAEAIRGATASPLAKTPFDGRITTKGAIHYAHLFSRTDSGEIEVPFHVSKASLLAGGVSLEVRANGQASVIVLPAKLPDPIATVIRME